MLWDANDSSAREFYSKQLLLPEVGLSGQSALLESSVLLVGAGGLAAPILSYLAAAGVGRIVVLDSDAIELSNLPRQFLFRFDDVGKSKVDVAVSRLRSVPPGTVIESYAERLTPENAAHFLGGITVAIDASDNFGTRFLLNDACRLAGIPWVHGAVTRFSGLLSTFLKEGPCYRCFFPEPPTSGRIPACGDAGVLGPAVGVVGSWQALEAIKICLGKLDATLSGRVMSVDLWTSQVEFLTLPRDGACLLCGDRPEIVSVDLDERSYRGSWGGALV